MGNAVFAGCRLRDVLQTVGVTYKNDLHVAFESVEQASALSYLHDITKSNAIVHSAKRMYVMDHPFRCARHCK